MLGSADSDFTPLLIRLRAAGRDTTLVSSRDVAPALAAVTDRVLGPADLVELIGSDPPPPRPAAFGEFARLVRHRCSTASTPIPLAALAAEAHQTLGPEVHTSKWYGHGSFARALTAVGLPQSRIENGYLSSARWTDAGAEGRVDAVGTMPRRALPQSAGSCARADAGSSECGASAGS
ncbi:MAG: hypothetical protein QM779_03765 [Propionicimonas sp.]|uniref:hypothetical protein n=1 Tax=Propionicimonas sp. TaxID=1955623 RepID=UPI003D09DFF8